jgi:hypothetical protein
MRRHTPPRDLEDIGSIAKYSFGVLQIAVPGWKPWLKHVLQLAKGHVDLAVESNEKWHAQQGWRQDVEERIPPRRPMDAVNTPPLAHDRNARLDGDKSKEQWC